LKISNNIISTSSSTVTKTLSLNNILEMCEEFLSSEETSNEVLQKKYYLKEALKRHLLLAKKKTKKMCIGIPTNGFFIIKICYLKKQISTFVAFI